jgi:hypothetical protein
MIHIDMLQKLKFAQTIRKNAIFKCTLIYLKKIKKNFNILKFYAK